MAFAEFTFRSPSLSPLLWRWRSGAGLRLIAMIGYPGALWFAGDSYVYLGAALRPQPNLSKTTGYSVFLHALEPFHSLTLVAAVQHLMGLAVAVMIYLLLRRNGVSQRWATAATLPVLLDGFVIEDEHMVMAEALFTFLVFVSMLLILWQTRVSWPVALLAGLLAGCAVDVRSEGLPVLLMFPVVLLVRGLRRDGTAWAGPVLAGLARLAGRRRDGRRLRGPGGGLRRVVPLLVGLVHAQPGRGVLPVGPGVLVRRMLRDQAASQRAGDLPVRDSRPAGPRPVTTSGTRRRSTTWRTAAR